MQTEKKRGRGALPRHSTIFMKNAVRVMLTENLSLRDTAQRFGVSYQTISKWLRKFRDEIEIIPMPPATPIDLSSIDQAKDQEILQLREALAKANLTITALESLIDWAQDEYALPIRKKDGTKQSSL